ncbi:YybH family protein [Streptomyces sp. NPDC055037]
MQAKTPEDVDNLFFEAMNRGDIDAALALHEPDARWYLESGEIVIGLPDIRTGLTKFLELKPTFTAEVTAFPSEDGDASLLFSTWNLVGTDADGRPTTMKGKKSRELVRRQPDGSWKFAIISAATD